MKIDIDIKREALLSYNDSLASDSDELLAGKMGAILKIDKIIEEDLVTLRSFKQDDWN